jgi:hypothetical protein
MAWWEELTSEEQARMPDDWVPGEMPLSGTPSDILAKYNPAIAARQEMAASSGFEEFAAQFELTDESHAKGAGRVIRNGVATNWTPWQLFNQSGGSGGSVWADEVTDGDSTDSPDSDPTGGDDARNQEIANTFKDAFIGGLQEVGLDNETITALWNWAEGRFTGDASFTAAQAMIEVYDQDAFIKRFPGIDQMRHPTDGEARRDIPSPGEYLQREKWLARELTKYGMDALGADLNNLITQSYVHGIGIDELEERLQTASRLIVNAPSEVRDTFGDWYGPHADAALMAAFLDPSDAAFGGEWKDWATLSSNVAVAEIGGWSRMRMGLDAPISKERAGAIAKLGLEQTTIWHNFDTIRAQEELFVEKLSEEADFTATGEGVAAEFGLDLDAADALERRRGTRAAEFAGGGGAMITGSTTGFGAANV